MRRSTANQTPPPPVSVSPAPLAVADDLYYDEDETDCPLCLEEMADSDRLFKPCPCGYQICRFCYHRIREEIDNKCPACRRLYCPEHAVMLPASAIKPSKKPLVKATSTPQAPSQAQAQSQFQVQTPQTGSKRSLVSENPNLVLPQRRHLIDLRVVQRNLVYVIGISPRIATEATLRDADWFGQCGRIVKVVVNRRNLLDSATPTNAGPSASAYITYARPEDAAKALAQWDGYLYDGRVMRASYGTTKYCSYFLRGISCPNAGCMYLHEEGQETDSFTKEQLQKDKDRMQKQRDEAHVRKEEAIVRREDSNPRREEAIKTEVFEPTTRPVVERVVSPPLESSTLFGEASSFLQRLASRFGEKPSHNPVMLMDLEQQLEEGGGDVPVSLAFLSDNEEGDVTPAFNLGCLPNTVRSPSASLLADIWGRSQANATAPIAISSSSPSPSFFDDPAVMMATPAAAAPWDPVVLPPGIQPVPTPSLMPQQAPMMTTSMPASQRHYQHHLVLQQVEQPSPTQTPQATPALPPQQEPKTVVATPLVVTMSKPSPAVQPGPQAKVVYQTAAASATSKKATAPTTANTSAQAQVVTLPPANPAPIAARSKSTVKTTIITTAKTPAKATTTEPAKATTPAEPAKKKNGTFSSSSSTTPTATPAPAAPANPFSLLMAPMEEDDEDDDESEESVAEPIQLGKKSDKIEAADKAHVSKNQNKKRQLKEDDEWSAEERAAFNAQVEAIRSVPLQSLSLPDLTRHIELLEGLYERSRADQERLEAHLKSILAPIH